MRFQLDPTSTSGLSVAPETQKVVHNGGYAGSPDITRVLQPGANVTFTGQGSQQSPYIVNAGASQVFTPQATQAYTRGLLYYDTDNESLSFFNNDSNISLQIGQEDWVRVVNNTGVAIANGAAVYISGSSSGMPTIALAKADAAATTVSVGLATETIANGASGFVTILGLVNGLDTTAFAVGAIYLSATTAGALTQTAPVSPNYRYRIGFVTNVSSTVGKIHVTPSTAALGNGTANQVAGINTGGTAQEYKSITGSAGIVVTNGVGSIALTANFVTTALKRSLVTASATGAVATTTAYEMITTGASAVTRTLFTPVGNGGLEVYLQKVDAGAGAVTIATAAGSILGGITSLATQFKHVTYVSDNANWYVKENN